PLAAAQRELLEETGLVAKEWHLLGTAHLSNSITDEEAFCFVATGLTQRTARPEGNEKLENRCVTLDEALAMVESGEISDALSIIGILRYLRSI
ncbi:MAG: NUDIX hydrolase, partial [Rubrobacteraceae bacterium]